MTIATQDLSSFEWPKNANEVPKDVFVRDDVFERELEVFFYGKLWHLVAHVAEMPNIGDFKTFELGRVPLMIIRGEDNIVRVFENACAHRGAQIETEPCGNRKTLECPYHRWWFKTNGELGGCPNADDFSPGFSKADYGLKKLRTAEYMGLIFATMSDETPDLETWLGGSRVTAAISCALEGGVPLRLLGYQKTQYASNWKAYGDNDGYHPPLLHTGFRLLGWQGGKGEQFATANGHAGVVSQLKPVANAKFLNDPSLVQFKKKNPEMGSAVVCIYPLSLIIGHLDIISVRFAIAKSADRTDVHYAYFARCDDDEEMVRHRVQQASNLLGPCGMISMEDAAIFQRIHIGSNTTGTVAFQKGVTEGSEKAETFKQNDESANLPKWEYYRKMMGFKRRAK